MLNHLYALSIKVRNDALVALGAGILKTGSEAPSPHNDLEFPSEGPAAAALRAGLGNCIC